jgi:hypothetical protein
MLVGGSLNGGTDNMKSSKLAFSSAITLVAAVVTAPARAVSVCATAYTQADGPAQNASCQTPKTIALFGAQTWSNFFSRGTGATYTKIQGELFVAEDFQLASFVLCANGAIASAQTGTNVTDNLVGCPSGVLAALGQGQIVLNP